MLCAQLRRARSPSLAFHEGNVAFSKEIALLPSPGHFPIDLDEICQNIVTLDPADAFSGGPKRRLFGGIFPVDAGPEPIPGLSRGKYSFFRGPGGIFQ